MTILKVLLNQWRRLMGAQSVSVVITAQNPSEGYKIITGVGTEIEIFCREKVYKVEYAAPWYPTRYVTLYHVYCHFTGKSSPELEARLREEFTITPLLPWGSSRVDQKKAAINCYVDLILHHMKNSIASTA